MRNRALLISGLALTLGACSSTSTDNDGSTTDTTTTTDTVTDVPTEKLYAVATGNYIINTASDVTDGCKIGVDKPKADNGLIGVALPLAIDNATGDMTIGNPVGNPPVPSLGTGKVSHNKATLTANTMISAPAPSMCTLTRDVTVDLTVTADYALTLKVTRADTNRVMCDTADLTGDSCTSTWTWTMTRDTSAVDGGATD